MAAKSYGFPVYGTQGGGLARKEGRVFVFVEKSDCPGLEVGDLVPEEWDLAPANEAARHEGDACLEDYFGPSHFGF